MKNTNISFGLCSKFGLATVLASALVSPPVHAQVSAPPDTEAQSADIIVTGRKREERLIDVPIAITTLNADQLEKGGISDVTDLLGSVPSLFFVRTAPSGDESYDQLVIRGIGATPVVEPAVGTFVNGVYQPSLAFDLDFLDVERVEILRGPQGTLFGRNTQGGAVSITTRKPGPSSRAKVGLRVDEFGTVDLQGSLSGPIAENLFGGGARAL